MLNCTADVVVVRQPLYVVAGSVMVVGSGVTVSGSRFRYGGRRWCNRGSTQAGWWCNS